MELLIYASPQLFKPKAKTRKIYLDNLISPLIYQNEITQQLIRTYKYNQAKTLDQTILDLILNILKPKTISLIQQDIDGITCIPLHKSKEKKRGFNQADRIAKPLAKELRLPYEKNLIIRKFHTKPQASLNRKNRLKNMKKVFESNHLFNLKGLNILIIDDVATTLSTLNEAAKILKKSGAKKVWGLTIAR